jgi:predicted GNAT family acetyltransferase
MEVVRNDALGRFEIALPGGALAFADFEVRGGAVLFPHTVVPPAHEGQGLGSALVRASLDWARAEGLKVVPLCSFYARYMERHPEARDLLAS